jgi:DNA modification methylase
MTALVVRADAGRLPLADDSVDLIVTSPPYFALRSYQDGGVHYAGQIGSEPTPAEFLAALWACTVEWMRVLKPSGSIWVNLGDKYNAYNGGRGDGTIQSNDVRQTAPRGNGLDVKDIKPKSLLGMPWRYAIGCIDQLGLILRANVIWSKPNGLPESVTDRVRRSHEDWFHFTKLPRYFAAVDEIREPHARLWGTSNGGSYGSATAKDDPTKGSSATHRGKTPYPMPHTLGKLPGSVWSVPSEPLTVPDHLGVDHFAAFPTEWPRRIIQGWSPAGICTTCGEGRTPTIDKGEHEQSGHGGNYAATPYGAARHGCDGSSLRTIALRSITGYSCTCVTADAPTRPAVILDPFGGTGTTALCASVLGRIGISVDLSHDYSRLAQWRTTDPGQRAKAMRVEKPPLELVGQDELFAS